MKADRIPREHYLAKLRAAKDTDLIKVIAGMRRCGKSTLMRMFMDDLVESGVSPEDMLFIDFDRDSEDIPRDHASLSAYVESILSPGPGRYLFLDEVQNVDGWEASVASFYSQGLDVYVTGSNSQMLSSELATKLSGRCVEIHVAPLAFSEYMLFREGKDAERLFGDYIRDGGLPLVARIEDELAKDIFPETLEGVQYRIRERCGREAFCQSTGGAEQYRPFHDAQYRGQDIASWNFELFEKPGDKSVSCDR